MKVTKRHPMRAEVLIFSFTGIFFTLVTPIYWLVAREIAGTWALGLAAALGWMVTGYLWITSRHIDVRYEDDVHGEIADGAGELGFFPPHSIWPFWCALTLSIMVLGPVFGWWLTLLGMGIGIWALCGWVYEYYRGDYQH